MFRLSRDNARELFEAIKDNYSLGFSVPIERNSLEDEMKKEHLNNIWDDYTSFEIEKLLPKK